MDTSYTDELDELASIAPLNDTPTKIPEGFWMFVLPSDEPQVDGVPDLTTYYAIPNGLTEQEAGSEVVATRYSDVPWAPHHNKGVLIWSSENGGWIDALTTTRVIWDHEAQMNA